MYCWINCFSSCCGCTGFLKNYLSDILLHNDMRCQTSFFSLIKCISLLFIDKGKKTTINRNELQIFMTLRSSKLKDLFIQAFLLIAHTAIELCGHTWSDTNVRELIAVKVLLTSLLNTTVVAFKVLPLGSYAPITAPSPPLKTILETILWNGLQSCCCIIPDVINVIKMPSLQYFLYLREQKKGIGCQIR